MEKERKVKVLSLAALVVAVLGLTVAFAALSQTLTINGTASVNASEWDIHFANLSDATIEGAATTTKPVLSGTSISGYAVTLTKPGDSVTYEFDIVNGGSVDATLSSKPTIPLAYSKCTGIYMNDTEKWETCKVFDLDKNNTVNVSDYSVIREWFNYGLYYVDTGKEVKANDTLNAGETKRVKLIVEYNYDAEELPENNFELIDSSENIELYYEQSE